MHWLKNPITPLKKDVKLLKITEVDGFYRSNPFILSGYRDQLSWPNCLKSLLVLHNETINIWSHLLGFLFFVALFWRDILFLIPAKESGVEVSNGDFFVLVSLIICYQLTMVLSSFYHTFSCHSPKVSENCLSLDLLGITMGLLATYLSGIYYAFWCLPFWRDFYLSTVGGLFIIATLAQFIPGFGEDKHEKKKAWIVYVLGHLWYYSNLSLGNSAPRKHCGSSGNGHASKNNLHVFDLWRCILFLCHQAS